MLGCPALPVSSLLSASLKEAISIRTLSLLLDKLNKVRRKVKLNLRYRLLGKSRKPLSSCGMASNFSSKCTLAHSGRRDSMLIVEAAENLFSMKSFELMAISDNLMNFGLSRTAQRINIELANCS